MTTTENEQRGHLALIIEREQTRAKFRKRPTDAFTAPADAIYAAGYRKPRTVTTVEELDALAEGSVVMGFDMDREQLVSAKQYGEWRQAGTDDGWQANGLIENYGELTVLHEPEAEVGA